MLKIYDEEVFFIDLDEYKTNIRKTLENILKNPDYAKMVFLLKKEGKIVGAANIASLLKNQIIYKTFSDREGVFLKAGDYCVKNNAPYGTYFPVLNEMGECVYLLYYIEDKIYTTLHPKGKNIKIPLNYDLEKNEKNYDYLLVENADVYIFSELEEYTYIIILLLAKKYPHKTFLMLDKKVSYFPELADCTVYVDPVEEDWESISKRFYKKHCLWIISDGINYNGFPYGYLIEIYNSINVLYSMIWCQKRERLGEKNKDCIIYLEDSLGSWADKCGLLDYMTRTYKYYLIAKRHGWKFCIDLSRWPNQYLMAEGENMWEYFFEPLSDISIEEAYESFSVIRASKNEIHAAIALPYMRGFSENHNKETMKTIQFNENTKRKIDELMPEILKRDNKVLGVILRGTDYRKEANERIGRNKEVASLEKMIAKCKFIMELYGYTHIFLATEDLEYFQRMKEEFGDKCLSIDQKRVYHDYNTGYKSCAEVLKVENGKEFGWRYLAIIQSLANCKSLIANMDCGATWAAKSLNDSKYEYFEVVSS